jgi:hypothetical protein
MHNVKFNFQFCADNGGMLAEPRRKKETNVINKMIKKHAGDESYWIGMFVRICDLDGVTTNIIHKR